MEKESTKKRDSNFELLRIIAMFMIVSLHYIQNNGMLELQGNFTNQNIIFLLINTICSVGVNCFILISGFYLIHSQFKIQKVLKLWGLVLFYSLGIYLFYVIIKHPVIDQMTLIDNIYVFTPILNVHYWFLVPYLALYIIFPFLNKMIKSLNKKGLKTILIIFFVLLCVINNITPLTQNFEAVGGHSILWFIFLYAVGAYMKLYCQEKNEGKAKKYKYLAGYIITILIAFIAKLLLEKIAGLNILTLYYNYRVVSFNSVFICIAAIALFMFFKDVHIKNTVVDKVITSISPNVIAVYLIHEHTLNRKVIWNIKVVGMENDILHYIFSVVCIFMVCILIEQIRKWIFRLVLKIPPFKKIQSKVHEQYKIINAKINQLMEN